MISFFCISPIYAQDITTDEILGNQEEEVVEEDLEAKEEEREQDFLNQLLLDIPYITDNPSHIITFVDPSDNEEGVQIEIDGKSFNDITSPYSLPALSIGMHELRFKFVDKYGSTQILEKELIVIPRPPIINSPTFNQDSLVISGTGLANSELVLILSSGKSITTESVDIDGDGDWEITISNGDLQEGLFTFTAYTRRYGYTSNLAEPVTFEIGESQISTIKPSDSGISFSFKDISFENLTNIISNNEDLVILIAGTFTFGFVLSFILFSIFKTNKDDKDIKVWEKKINNGKEKKEEITLKEKLSGKKEVTPKKEPEKKEEEKKEDKVVTKIDFLKDFKMFDPDNEKGEEKKDIKVTLTSKE